MRSLCLSLLLAVCFSVQAAESTNRIVSPEVRSDGMVTFRLEAPKVASAGLMGDWMAPGAELPMKRDLEGLWSITVGPLNPGIYIYNFTISGVSVPDPVNPQIKLRARGSASLLEVKGTSELWDASGVPHGTIEIVPHRAKTLGGQTRQVWIYKPPGYDDHSFKRYPVLYLLHGSNDTPAGWTTVGRANYIMDNLIADEKAKEMLIVMPFGHAVAYDAPREAQATNTATFAEYLLKDLMPLVEKQYRVNSGRKNRAIVGLSMGGGQAFHIGLEHLDQFSAIGMFSAGGVSRANDDRLAAILQNKDDINKKLSLFWIGCGKEDGAFAGSKELAARLKDKGINHTFRELPGRHTYAVWRECFSEVAPLLFQR